MSGSTIGGVVGAVVGFYFGGPQGAQIGWMVGSAVGGYIDPEVIKAPSIGDAQAQTSSDGVPIAVVYGSPPPFMGNVIDGEQKARKIITEDDGKGGPVVEQEHFILTSAVGICEGPIEGVAFIVQDGNLVYDKRPNPKIPASETAKFESKIRLYLGTEDQNPDPALEAIHGVDNTCYYRGLAYMVIVDDDRTQYQGRVGQYAFGVVKNGTTTTIETESVTGPLYGGFANTHFPLVDAENRYTYEGHRVIVDGGLPVSYAADSKEAVIAHFNALGYNGVAQDLSYYQGYSANTNPDPGAFSLDTVETQLDVTDNTSVLLIYNVGEAQEWFDAAPVTACPLLPYESPGFPEWYGFNHGELVRIVAPSVSPPPQYTGYNNCFEFPPEGGFFPFLQGAVPLYITVSSKTPPVDAVLGDPCDLEMPVQLPDAAGFVVDCDGLISPAASYSPVTGDFLALQAEATTTADSRLIYTRRTVGPVMRDDDANNNETYWEAAYAAAEAAGTVESGLVYGVDYPQALTDAYSATLSRTEIEAGEFSLQEFQEDIADRCGVPASRIDASALADDVLPGMLIAIDSTGADASRVPQQVYFYDLPEYDGKIRAVKRGGEVVGTLTDDDFVDVAGEDDDVRMQEIEIFKKLHLAYPDPVGNYAITKQTFSRDSVNVNAKGELVIGTPIPFNADEAAQKVDIMGKVMWASAEGRMSRTLPRRFTTWVPSDCFNYNGKRWRIEKSDVADGTNAFEAVYDRKDAYTSIATGASARTPASQTSNLRGPSRFEFVNASPLQDSQDRIGGYFGVSGILDGWIGAAIFVRPVGTVDYTSIGNFSNRAVMGHTTTLLPSASPWVFDPDGTVTVKVHGGAPDSTTFVQLLNEANAAIIGDEIIQFQTAVEVDELTYQLTGLTRARHNTDVEEHAIHSRFVLLSGLNFYEFPSAWIGRSLEFYIQSLGTPAGMGYTETHIWSPALIQTEWSPVRFKAPRNSADDATLLSWVGRGRLGTNAAPFQSQYFNGYRITLSLTGSSISYLSATPSLTYTDAQRTIDFGSLDPLDVSITALSRIPGGNSSALTGTI